MNEQQMSVEQGEAWRERAELAERENARLHAVVEELRAKLPQSLSLAAMQPMIDLKPVEMLRLAADMYDARQYEPERCVCVVGVAEGLLRLATTSAPPATPGDAPEK